MTVAVYVYVITPFGVVLLVYPPDSPKVHSARGGRVDKMLITVDWSLLGKPRTKIVHPPKQGDAREPAHNVPTQLAQPGKHTIDADISREQSRERMAEAFHLEVEGWDSETSLQVSMSESSAPGDGPSASKRRRLSLSLTRKKATCTTSTATERFGFLDDAKSEALTKKFVPKLPNKALSGRCLLSFYNAPSVQSQPKPLNDATNTS